MRCASTENCRALIKTASSRNITFAMHALLGIADYAKADIIKAEYLKFLVSTPKFIANLTTNVLSITSSSR